MMILDLQQVMLATILVDKNKAIQGGKVDRDFVRHMILNSIRYNRLKFSDYGELVIACDSRDSWRREMFPFYKASRKKNRETSTVDWADIFDFLASIRSDLKEHFPYRTIEVNGAEADDIIATVVKKECEESMHKVLILSGDKDFIQLQTFINVSQWDPTRKRWIKHPNPEYFLKEHIIKGDISDGVPNMLSGDSTFVSKGRQKPIRADKLERWCRLEIGSPELRKELGETIWRNWCRNNQMINLDNIPKNIVTSIFEEYEKQGGKGKKKILPYLMDKNLREIAKSINEF